MNKQRKVVITTTYNEMGIIIDTKAEEVAQPNLQPTCNQLATDVISRQAAIDALAEHEKSRGHNYTLFVDIVSECAEIIRDLPPAQTEWNNHEVACLLAELFDDDCACNFNGIDEWLPLKCDFAETCCPHPVGVACWEQYLKHRSERRTDG